MPRKDKKEWIDLGPSHYTLKEYRDCLEQLDMIGRYLGGDRATFWALRSLKVPLKSILDVGCGGGRFTQRLGQRYPEAKVLGVDLSHEAIQYALELPALKNVEFAVPPSSQLLYPDKSFDLVTSTLLCHHLSDHELIKFLKEACRIAKRGVLINDLHRHPVAMGAFFLASHTLFRNRLVKHDGLLSIQRSFKKSDWIAFLKEAHIALEKVSITWHWAFRWMVMIRL